MLTASQLADTLAGFTPPPTQYTERHLARFAATLNLVPKGTGTVVDLGGNNHFDLLLRQHTAYDIQPQNLVSPIAGGKESPDATFSFHSPTIGVTLQFTRTTFDVERDRFPYADGSVQGVFCCELLEHLVYDPAWMLHEINRVLSTGGWLILTTPNITGWHAIRKAVLGIHPMEHTAYYASGYPVQHTREYTPFEVRDLLGTQGFSVDEMSTHQFFDFEQLGVRELPLLAAFALYNVLHWRHPRHLLPKWRRPHTLVRAIKRHAPAVRYPKPLYVV